MALIPKPNPYEVVLVTENGTSTLIVDSVLVSEVLLLTESGYSMMSVTGVVPIDFVLVTESGVSHATVEMVEDEPTATVKLSMFYDMAQIQETKPAITFAYDVHPLVVSKVSTHYAYTMGVLQGVIKGFGFEYDMGVIGEGTPILSMGYVVNSEDGVGFDILSLDLGWAREPSVSDVFLSMSYMEGYQQDTLLGLGWARTFYTAFKYLTLSAYKERFLWASAQVKMPFGVQKGVSVSCGTQAKVLAGVEVPIPAPTQVIAGVAIDCNISHVLGGAGIALPLNAHVLGGFTIDMSHIPHVRGGVSVELPIRNLVVNGSQVVYALLAYTPVLNGVTVSVPASDVSPITQSTEYVLQDPTGLSPEGIKLLRAEVVAEEGSFGWSGTFVLENPLDLNKFTAHSMFEFVLGADTYVFMVDSKGLNRTGPAEREATLKGISPSAKLVAPRAKKISKTWTETTTAHDIMTEVLDGYQAQIELLNWPLPANRYGVEATAPMDILIQLAAAVGGIVDTLPSGTLRIRPKYYHSTNIWGPGLVDHVYSDFDDIYTSNDEDAPIRIFDKFRVMDAEVSESGDRLEYTEVTPTSGEVRAYPSPWRTTCFLDTTSPSCSIGAATVEYREVEEVIEIYNGEGAVQYPVNAVVSLEWMERDLLGVVAGNDSTKITSTHALEKFSLLKIKYTTRCLVYTVTGYVGQQAQFLLRNP